MEALKRKVDLSTKRSMTLDDGTIIEYVPVTVGKAAKINKIKGLNEFERGIHSIAAQIRVDGQEVCYDDLLDCFTTEEMSQIIEFVNPPDEKND